MNKNFLDIDNVTFVAGETHKVSNVSFSIENEGDVICLLGPSGIGKTTILRTIAGLQKVKKGNIKLKNKIISSEKIHVEPELRNISLSFQDNCLFPHYTLEKNIYIGAERKLNGKDKIDSNNIINFLNLKKILEKSKITTIIVTHDSYEAFYLGGKCGIILEGQLKQFDDPYNVYHFPNSVEVVNFLNRGILIPAKVTGEDSLENDDLGTIKGNFIKRYSKGSKVQLLLQPEDLEHDDKSNLKLEVVDRKFRGTNFIYTLKTLSNLLIPVFVHSHHIHQHEIDEKFGIKRPINIDHIVCF